MSELLLDRKPPLSFWIFSGAALVWNLIGLLAYISIVTIPAEVPANMSAEVHAFYMATPVWATSAFAVAVTAGVLGSLFLLLRKSWALPMYIVSLLGVIVQNLDAFVLRDAYSLSGINSVILPALIFIAVVLLIFYSRAATARGWLS